MHIDDDRVHSRGPVNVKKDSSISTWAQSNNTHNILWKNAANIWPTQYLAKKTFYATSSTFLLVQQTLVQQCTIDWLGHSAKLKILVKINSNVLRLYILQCALLSTTDRSFRNRQQRNERKYTTIFQQEINCLITVKWSYSNLTFHYTEVLT